MRKRSNLQAGGINTSLHFVVKLYCKMYIDTVFFRNEQKKKKLGMCVTPVLSRGFL